MERIPWAAALAASALLGGCASAPVDDLLGSSEVVRTHAVERGEEVPVARFSGRAAGEALPPHWEPYIILPSKPRTLYRLVDGGGQGAAQGRGAVLEAAADASASGKLRRIRIDPESHPVLEWRWRVEEPVAGGDMRHAATEDSPARLIVSFHGDASKLDFAARAQLRMARALSGRALPYATLMYVWSNAIPVETVLENPHTDRIRMIVVASGRGGIGQWQSYRRNVLEDYRRAFGEDPGDFVAVGLMTDADNTRQKARCLYGDITFLVKQ
jgi:hypothetical protein